MGEEKREHGLSEELFSRLFIKSPIATAVTRISDGRILQANEAFADLTGHPLKKMIGSSTIELNIWGDLEDRRSIGRFLEEEGSVQNVEIEVRTSAGESLTCLYSGQLIDFLGEPHILSMAVDVTERKDAERALRESEENFRALAENAGEGISILADDGYHVYANRKAAEITGYNVEDLILVNMADLIHPDEFGKISEIFRKRMAGEPLPSWYETVIVRRDGRSVPVSVSGARTAWRGRPADIVLFRDISERREAERALKEHQRDLEGVLSQVADKNKEFESFVYAVSHDLKVPIVTIGGFIDALREDFKDLLPERGREYLEYVRNASRDMELFVNNLIHVSRIGRVSEKRAAFPFEELVWEALEPLRTQIESRGIRVKVREGLPVVRADRMRLGQVVDQLLANAVRHIGENNPSPGIEVGAEEIDGFQVFFVRDNGVGMDPRSAERVFEILPRRFRRKGYFSSGIGLMLCRKVIESHGGRIWLESEQGKGSTFYFTLPDHGV